MRDVVALTLAALRRPARWTLSMPLAVPSLTLATLLRIVAIHPLSWRRTDASVRPV